MKQPILNNTDGKPASPVHLDWLQVEVSARCNASCAYCVLTCYKQQWQGDLMDMQTFDRLAPAFPMADLVFLQGWGEPLLHPRFWDMVQRAKAAGCKVGFTTNAMALSARHRQQLLDSDTDIMGVSIAGINPATHNRFRQGCDFEKLDSTMLKLNALRRQTGLVKPELHLAVILLRSNWQELAQLPALAHKWGVAQIIISNLTWIAVESLQQESILLHPALWSGVTDLLETIRQQALQRGIQLHYYGPQLGAPQLTCKENVMRACYVSWCGDVSPCVFTNLSLAVQDPVYHYFNHKRHAVESLIYGNIHEQELIDIWNSRKALAFRAAFERRQTTDNRDIESLPEPCQHCYKLVEQ